jgi:hypothetical protein
LGDIFKPQYQSASKRDVDGNRIQDAPRRPALIEQSAPLCEGAFARELERRWLLGSLQRVCKGAAEASLETLSH